jgi:hypothetical protein
MQLGGTKEQQLIFLNTHWGRRYAFTAPQAVHGNWIATANFGQHDKLEERSATELLFAVRRHYADNQPETQ